MLKVLEKETIKQPGMNPWKKDLKRDIFSEGNRYFIKRNGKHVEVEKLYETWFIK